VELEGFLLQEMVLQIRVAVVAAVAEILLPLEVLAVQEL
jgi:hypothetical protein